MKLVIETNKGIVYMFSLQNSNTETGSSIEQTYIEISTFPRQVTHFLIWRTYQREIKT